MRILVFQHVAVEHPGVFREFWTDAGHTWSAVDFEYGQPIPNLEEFDLLVAMGGPMDVWQEDEHPWLVPEKDAIRDWVLRLERPFLGVCLGHQLLAEALGGTVGLMPRPEVGLASVHLSPAGRSSRLFNGLGDPIETFQWHSAQVTRPPEGASVLAVNDACPVQAMQCGRYAFGIQFHCEIIGNTVREWQEIPAYRRSLQEAVGDTAAERMSGDVARLLPDFREAARRLNGNLMSLVR